MHIYPAGIPTSACHLWVEKCFFSLILACSLDTHSDIRWQNSSHVFVKTADGELKALDIFTH